MPVESVALYTHRGNDVGMEEPASTPSRRAAIARAVITLAAAGGARAVTHSAIDRHLRLPKGSTSYYFRTRADLINAGGEAMRQRSRAEFATLTSTPESSPAEVTASYLAHLIAERSDEIRARLALAAELEPGTLGGLFFSHDSATALLAAAGAPDPALMATGFLDLIEGILLRAAFAPHADVADNQPTTVEIRALVRTYLVGATTITTLS